MKEKKVGFKNFNITFIVLYNTTLSLTAMLITFIIMYKPLPLR